MKEKLEPPIRKLAGWCTEVWNAQFDPARTPFEIVETDDGPYALCLECAQQVRTQLAYLEEKGKLPNA